MRVLTLASKNAPVLADVLVRRGWDPIRAESAAHGIQSAAFLFEQIPEHVRDSVAHASRGLGIECLTGDGWALIAGGRSRIAGLTRPGFSTLPDALAADLGGHLRGLTERTNAWQTARGAIPLDKPLVVGILNVTPDSFSDGGLYLTPELALDHADRLVQSGADLVDVGAESTRPGATDAVAVDEEWRRLEPVLGGLVARFPDVKISVDTTKSEIAHRSLEAGAAIVNDVSAFRLDPRMANICAEARAGVVLMHSRGTVGDMASYDHADYNDLVAEVSGELGGAAEIAMAAGSFPENLVLDPGLGFAKRPADNIMLLRNLDAILALGFPIMVGPSRKRFLRQMVDDRTELADEATAAACVSAYADGAILFRVHDVETTRAALRVAHALRG